MREADNDLNLLYFIKCVMRGITSFLNPILTSSIGIAYYNVERQCLFCSLYLCTEEMKMEKRTQFHSPTQNIFFYRKLPYIKHKAYI